MIRLRFFLMWLVGHFPKERVGTQVMRLIAALDTKDRATGPARALVLAALSALAIAVSGCTTTSPIDAISIDKTQGTDENISSLTDVIRRNPNDPEGYNVRGSAYGRSGQFRNALDDFNRALQLNPSFFQAYANRALIHRSMGNVADAANDYNRALQINPRYDVAYIGRGNLYRQAGRLNEAMTDYNRAINLQTTDPRAFHNRGLIKQVRGQHPQAIEDFSHRHIAGAEFARTL